LWDSIRIRAAKGWISKCSSIAKTDWNVIAAHHMKNVVNNVNACYISPAIAIDQNSLKHFNKLRLSEIQQVSESLCPFDIFAVSTT
jgi:hypothetical protein